MDIDNFIFNMYKSWDINHFNDAISLSKKSRWSDRVNEIFNVIYKKNNEKKT